MDINSFYKKLGLSYSDSFDFKVLKRSSTNRIVTLSINGKEFTGKSLYDKLGLRSLDFSLKKMVIRLLFLLLDMVMVLV